MPTEIVHVFKQNQQPILLVLLPAFCCAFGSVEADLSVNTLLF
jgi:hypothetical protein